MTDSTQKAVDRDHLVNLLADYLLEELDKQLPECDKQAKDHMLWDTDMWRHDCLIGDAKMEASNRLFNRDDLTPEETSPTLEKDE